MKIVQTGKHTHAVIFNVINHLAGIIYVPLSTPIVPEDNIKNLYLTIKR